MSDGSPASPYREVGDKSAPPKSGSQGKQTRLSTKHVSGLLQIKLAVAAHLLC